MYKFFKRFMDIFISLIGLIVLFPFLLIVALVIKIDSKGPVFFKQDRIGKNGKVFKIYKFRSMTVGAEAQGVYETKGDTRVTRVGRVIRKLSIDELPQFINILKGDMSIIGPRPTLTYHPWDYSDYTDFQLKRFNLRPGVTGWAQVNGRKDVEWNKRIELDVYYVENISIWLDIKIFFKTVWNVLTFKDNLNVGNTVKEDIMKLMYITKDPKIAKIAEESGVDWIFVDLEILGKEDRQGHLDTVISKHDITDIKPISDVLTKSELLVRVNPIHDGSKEEIDEVIASGADIVMLPFFKTHQEVSQFIQIVDSRAKVCLLLETPESVDDLDNILTLKGIDYIHLGLNDLHLGYELKFMFELLSNGMVENIIKKIKETNIEYGFGGIARLGEGSLPADNVIVEHYRLGSTMAILSRTFLNTKDNEDYEKIKEIFNKGIHDIRGFEEKVKEYTEEQYNGNKTFIDKKVDEILKRM